MSEANPVVAEEVAEIAENGYRLPSEQVLEFYKAFDEPIPEAGPASLDPSVIPEGRVHLKMKLIAEEFIELVEAVYGAASAEALTKAWEEAEALDDGTRDVVGAADALGDLQVVENGFAIEARIPVDAVLAEVHLSNLSKLDENGDPIRSDGVTPAVFDGKVKPFGKLLKGPSFFEPDLPAIMAGLEPDRTPKVIKDANR
jgi:predicted HAD superfamily Cof-like phosphohydrolase